MFDYVEGGADDEVSAAANWVAFRRWRLLPLNLQDVSSPDLRSELMGRPIAMPLLLAPTGYARMMHPDGEIAAARAARRAGLPYVLSTVASTSIEELAATGHSDLWFQLYVWRDRGFTWDLVARAWAAGYRVLELSVDVPVPGHRVRDLRNGLTIPPALTPGTLLGIAIRPTYWVRMLRSPPLRFANAPQRVDGGVTIENMTAQFDPSLTWDDLAEVRRRWPGELLVKGCLGVGDSRRAIEAGADGVHLSNHGGRQLDRAVAPIDLVRPVRDALGAGPAVIVDSGVRHGSDVAVALALGADAAAVGRAYLYGLMAAGETGVDRALELLRTQFSRTLQLLGTPSVAALRARGSDAIIEPGVPPAR